MEFLSNYPDLVEFLNWLDRVERHLEIPWDSKTISTGKSILKRIFENNGSSPINVIPPIGRPGKCTRILFVAIGTKDSIEKRILEAFEFIAGTCANRTKYVVFYCAKWNHATWLKHAESFRKYRVIVIKKELLSKPIRLL